MQSRIFFETKRFQIIANKIIERLKTCSQKSAVSAVYTGYQLRTDTFIVEVVLSANHDKIPSKVAKAIRNTATAYLIDNGFSHVKVAIILNKSEPKNQPLKIIGPEIVAHLILIKFTQKIIPKDSLLSWFNETSDKSYEYKITKLMPMFDKTVFTEDFKRLFPAARGLNRIEILDLSFQIQRVGVNIVNEKFTELAKGYFQMIQDNTTSIMLADDSDSYDIIWGHIVKEIADKYPTEVQSRYQSIQKMLKELIDCSQALYEEMSGYLKQCNAIMDAMLRIHDIFDEIPYEDQIKLMGQAFFDKMPHKDEVAEMISVILSNLTSIFEVNLESYRDGLEEVTECLDDIASCKSSSQKNLVSIVFDHSSSSLSEEDAEFSHEETTQEALTDNAASSLKSFQDSEEKPAQTIEVIETKNLEAIEIKKRAQELIQKEQSKAKRHTQRSGANLKAAEIFQPPRVHAQRCICIKLNSGAVAKISHIFPLAESKHLYFCCNSINNLNNKYEVFRNVMSLGKLLPQDSLGTSGLKSYTLDSGGTNPDKVHMLVVKSKQLPAEHLLCFLHPIANTDDHVFLPEDIISHRDYEKLINNYHDAQARSNRAREKISVAPKENNSQKSSRVALKPR